MTAQSFSARIQKIGINPYVLLPDTVLKNLFEQAGKNKGPVQVKGELNGHAFKQTLVKYSGKWRLYLNTPMRVAAGIDVGDTARVKIVFDPEPRLNKMHPVLRKAFAENKPAGDAFKLLAPYYQKEIIRYINNLKSDEAIKRNVEKAVLHVLGKARFIGRD